MKDHGIMITGFSTLYILDVCATRRCCAFGWSCTGGFHVRGTAESSSIITFTFFTVPLSLFILANGPGTDYSRAMSPEWFGVHIKRISQKENRAKIWHQCLPLRPLSQASGMPIMGTSSSFYLAFSPSSPPASLPRGLLRLERKRPNFGGTTGCVFQAWYGGFDRPNTSHTSSREGFDYFSSSLS